MSDHDDIDWKPPRTGLWVALGVFTIGLMGAAAFAIYAFVFAPPEAENSLPTAPASPPPAAQAKAADAGPKPGEATPPPASKTKKKPAKKKRSKKRKRRRRRK